MSQRPRLDLTDARKSFAELKARLGVINHDALSKEQLFETAKLFWEITYCDASSDEEAFNNLSDWADRVGRTDPGSEMAAMARGLVDLPNEQIKVTWAGRWYDQGCPRIVVDEKYAALLMATDGGPEIIEFAQPPWKAFMIDLPEGLLTTWNEKANKFSSLRQLFVHHVNEGIWNFIAEAQDGIQLWRHGLTLKDMLTVDPEMLDDWNTAEFLVPIEERDERIMALLGRFILSVCLAMSNPDNFREQKRTKGRGGARVRFNRDAPALRTFVLGRPVTVDCRSTIKDYVERGSGSKRGKLQVQLLVRGHWRRVACGPQGLQRKLKHIEPYWKGDVDKAIQFHTHVLKGT